MDTTTAAEARDEFSAVRGGGSAASRGNLSTGAAARYVSNHSHPPPPPPPPPHHHLSPLHSHHIHHHLHHSGTSTATGLLMTGPAGMLDSTAAAADAAAHYGQSPGNNNASLRTGVPHEIGRPGPPHATPAASVSAPSPLPPLQCQDRFFSSLTINTGSSYGFLNGVPAPTFSAASIPAPMSASSPFRTPPGLASVHSHWSHTPPPSPLETYGRYGLGTNLYSLYPMLTGNDANALCLQASAAKLLQRTSPYYPVLDRTRDFGLYHPASFSIGSPFSPGLATLDPGDLSGSGGSTSGSLPDFLQQRMATSSAAPFDYMCKNSNNHNININQNSLSGGGNSCSTKIGGTKASLAGANGTAEDDKSRRSSITTKDSRAKSSVSGKNVGLNGKVSTDSSCRPLPTLSSPKDQKMNGGDNRFCATGSESTIIKREGKSDSCRKKHSSQKQPQQQQQLTNTCAESDVSANSSVGVGAGQVVLSPVNEAGQIQALNLSQDMKKPTITTCTSTNVNTASIPCNKSMMNEYARLYGTSFFPFDPTQLSLALRVTPSTTTSVTQSSLSSYSATATTSSVCDKNVRVKVEPEVKGPQRVQCPYQGVVSTLRPDASVERQTTGHHDKNNANSRTNSNGLNGVNAKNGDYLGLNLMPHQNNNDTRRDDQMCCSKERRRTSSHNDGFQPVLKCHPDDMKKQSVEPHRGSCSMSSEELNNKLPNTDEKQLPRLPTPTYATPLVAQSGKGLPTSSSGFAQENINSDESFYTKTGDSKLTTAVKDETSNKVVVKGSHIESITNKLLAKSQLGVSTTEISTKPAVAQSRVPQHTKCRRKSVVVDKIVAQNEMTIVDAKHSSNNGTQSPANQPAATNESSRNSPQAVPYDYTLKQQSCNSTFTVTTTSPLTPTTTTMALPQVTSGSSFQRCFTEHVHKSLTTSTPISSEIIMSDRLSSSSSSSSASSSSSSPINVTDIDSSPTTKWSSNAQSEDKVLSKFASKNSGIDVQLFDRKLRPKLSSAHESNSNSSVEGSSLFSHSLTTGISTIPVGIAVAQQRQEVQSQCKQRTDSINCKQEIQKCGTQSGSPLPSKSNELSSSTKSRQLSNDLLLDTNKMVCFDKPSSGDASGVVSSSSDFTPGLMIAGGTPLTTSCWANDDKTRWFPGGHPALWLGQSSFAGAPTSLSMQLGSADHLTASMPPHPPPHPFPPIGYQLARDPITNHLFLIPTANINLMERPSLWPTAPAMSQLPALHKSFQSCIYSPSLPTTATTNAAGAPQQPIASPLLAANRISQERPNFECNFSSEADKALNMSAVAVSNSQSGSEVTAEILSEKSSIVKGEDDEKVIVDPSSLTAPPTVTALSQPYCFDLQPNSVVATAESAIIPRTSSPPLPLSCPCHVTPCETKVVVDSSVIEQQQHVEVVAALKIEVTKMADACNQTETPPLTDEDEEDSKEDLAIACQSSLLVSTFEPKDTASNVLSLVKVEDMCVQCELSDEIEMSLENKNDDLNVQGLELLSKTIVERDLGAVTHDMKMTTSTPKLEMVDASKTECEKKEFDLGQCEQNDSLASHEDFGGLGLLCALAEQRILQETTVNAQSSDNTNKPTNKEATDAACKIPKANKEFRHFTAQKMSPYSTSSSTSSPSSNSSISVCSSNKGLTDNKSAIFSQKDSAEMEMRLKLADLQKKYKEKQKELAKLARKDSDHSKRKPGRPKKGKKITKSSFKFHHHLHRAKLSLLSCHKKSTASANASVTTAATNVEMSNESSNNAPMGRSILNPPTLVTSTPKNMSTLDKWTSSLAACPPSLFQLVPTLKKSVNNGTKSSSSSSSIFTNLKQQLPPPLSTKLSLTTLSTTKSISSEVSSPNKGQTTTPDETTTETSDSDDSSLCPMNKVKLKAPVSKSRPLPFSSKEQQRSKRRDGQGRNASGNANRASRGPQSEDSRDDHRSSAEVDLLSFSFMQTGSLSVSCTMPPFKGHDGSNENVKEEDVTTASAVAITNEEDEASSGLGLLANCAFQATTFEKFSTPLAVTDLFNDERKDVETEREENDGEKKNDSDVITNASSNAETTSDFSGNSTVDAVDSTKSQEQLAKKEMGQSGSSSTPAKCKYSYLEDEAWLRRRSERIFLNEPSRRGQTPLKSSFQSQNDQLVTRQKNTVSSSSSSSSSAFLYSSSFHNNNSSEACGGGVTREITVSAAVNAVTAVTGLTWKSKPEETKSKKRNSSKIKSESEPCVKKIKVSPTSYPKSPSPVRPVLENLNNTSIISHSSSDSDSDSPAETSSYSEGDNLPLSQLVDRPITPEPRSCAIKAEELKDNLRVLTMIDRLFYSGRVAGIRPPDVYGITVDGERGNRPHIYSREEILQEAVLEVKPGSIRYLPEGTRVCAYWSQQYRCLYPGTVAKSTSPSSSPESEDTVLVEFDDGDSGRISVDNVRFLPPDLPIISYDRDPLNIGKRRTKSTGDISQEKKTPIMRLADSHKDKTSSRSSDKLGLQSEDRSSMKPKDMLNESMINGSKGTTCSTNCPAQRKLFQTAKKSSGKKIHDEVNNNSSSVQSKLPTDFSQIPLVKALYGSQILSATVSVVPLSRSSTPTSSAGSTISTSNKAIKSVGAGFSSSSSTSSLLKSRKHKKHKNNKNDNRKRHHHHHRRHRHKHKHEKKLEMVQREQTNGIKVAKESAVENPSTASSLDGKKQELTLKIRTNVEANRSEMDNYGVKKESDNESSDWSNEKCVKSTESDQTPAKEPESKLLLLEEPLPPRKARIAKKEELSTVSSTRPKAKRKERSNSVETKSKIAAFLPARQLWRWSGKCFRRPGAKGKAKKDFYKAITRGKETIRVGDSAVFLSTGRPHLPFIGRIITMWESWGGNMIVKVRWFYHPEETKGGKKLVFNKGALYQSYHIDENDVQTISHKCEVLAWSEYRKYKDQEANQSSGSSVYDNCDVYYLAGAYDPTAGVVTLEDGVS